MTNNNFGFSDYFLYRDSLSPLIGRSTSIFEQLGQEEIAKNIKKTNNRLDSGVFRILIIGEFSRGKSTLINALLGEPILPVKMRPTTALVNVIKYGEEKKALMHFKHPLPEQRSEVTEAAERYILAHDPAAIPPMDIPYLQLKDYVVIKDRNKKVQEITASPYEKVDVYYPIELLSNGVEILDSPGLNEATSRSAITNKSLEEVDGIVYLFNAKSLGSSTEVETIQTKIITNGFSKIFYVINHWDDIVGSDKEDVIEDAYGILSDLTDYGQDGIFFLSAREALLSRMEQHPRNSYVEEFENFERKLYATLIKDAGNAKIQVALKSTRIELQKVDELVRDLMVSYDQTLEQTTRAYKRTLPLLEAARTSKDLTLSKILNVRHKIKELVSNRLEVKLHEISEDIPEWVEEMALENKLKAFFGNNKKISQIIASEIQDKVDQHIEAEILDWQEDHLKDDLEHLAKEMQSYIHIGRENLATQISLISEAFSGMEMSDEEREDTEASVSSRLLTGGLALLVGDIPLAIYGAQYGSKGIGRALVTQIGIGVALAIFSIANPFVWIAAAFGGSIFSSFAYNEKRNLEYKRKIGQGLQAKFVESIPKQTDTIAEDIFERTSKVSEEVEKSFDAEIQSQEEKVNHAFNLKKQGDSVVNKQRKIAQEQLREKDFILNELDKLEMQGV